jgi:hypothetical protein
MSADAQDINKSARSESSPAPEPPAMGERRARWGYGYQDKVATAQLLDLLRADIRSGTSHFEGVRLADLQAGRVDDFVLVTDAAVQGHSIKWSTDAPPVNWGDLIGANGLVRELAEGWKRLSQRWRDRGVIVHLQTNRPASTETHPAQLVKTFSVSEFFGTYWQSGPSSDDVPAVADVWKQIENHTGLAPTQFRDFTRACRLRFSFPQPPCVSGDSHDERVYLKQFDRLHKAIATWLTNNPDGELLDRRYILSAIGFNTFRSGLVQRFPAPEIPYARNSESALQIKQLLDSVSGGYVAITGPAGIGKSTLVQDVLSDYPLFVPYFAYLPDGVGNPRDRGEALTFFQDVVTRLDRFFETRHSLGVSDLSQGREALRTHMQKAKELFEREGLRTILLIDGLDHVQREAGLERAFLLELPRPDEVPTGFIIILSSQPQALLPNAIERHVSSAVSPQSQRRIEVEGLSRSEVHTTIRGAHPELSSNERDSLFEASSGNPLILTYLLKFKDANPRVSTATAIEAIGDYKGDIDRYYESALSVPLRESETRNLLALISRAAPTLPIKWLQTWPERLTLEKLYGTVLAPFVRVEGENLYFIHNSLISFLRSETRSILPGADFEQDEREYHRLLAERCGSAHCSDPVGRAKVFHLLRCERYRDLLNFLSPAWLREGIKAFVPHSEVHPILLHGISAAWREKDYGEVLRLILHDFEFDQRTARLGASDLCRKLLALDKPRLALSQIRSAGRILVEDKYALESSADLWRYAVDHGDRDLEKVSRNIYLQAKPLNLIYRSEPIDRQHNHDAPELLGGWADVAPLFERPESICAQIRQLRFGEANGIWHEPENIIKAALLYRAVSTLFEEGGSVRESIPVLAELARLRTPQLYFAALLITCRSHPTRQLLDKLEKCYSNVPPNPDLDLIFAELLFNMGHRERSVAICAKLRHIRVDSYRSQHAFGFTDVSYTLRFKRLQDLLGIEEGPVPNASDEDEEAQARIELVLRQLGSFFAQVHLRRLPVDLRETFRALLLFHNRPVKFAQFNVRSNYIVSQVKRGVYRAIADLASLIGKPGVGALKEVFTDIVNGPAGPQFNPVHRRFFASFFYGSDVLGREPASMLGLSDGSDVNGADPGERQEACLENAIFLNRIGDEKSSENWFTRASTASAGSGNHKDYHMALLADWLIRSCGTSVDSRKISILEKFVRSLEVAGGDGATRATAKILSYVVTSDAYRASSLAVELIDREMLNVEATLAALIEGGGKAGASVPLLVAIYSELLTLVATGSSLDAAVAVIRRVPQNRRAAIAQLLMAAVRTNSLPGYRVAVGRGLQDVLSEDGMYAIELTSGLSPGHDDSSMKSFLYKLSDNEFLTAKQMSLRLSDLRRQSEWNPNPSENDQFGWWEAIKGARVEDINHAEKLIETFPPADYKDVDVLAWKCEVSLKAGDRVVAKNLAEEALKLAEKRSWFTRFDGAQRRVAFAAMMQFDLASTVNAARDSFGSDLAKGKLWNLSLLDEIPEIFDFLRIDWPSNAVLSIVDDYLDVVLAACSPMPSIQAFSPDSRSAPTDTALCRFVVHLLSFPVVDIGVAARRSLARYASEDPNGPAAILAASECCDSVQLEHLVACLQVAGPRGNRDMSSLRDDIKRLDEHESIGVRAIARRLSEGQGWPWQEIRNHPARLNIVLPAIGTSEAADDQLIASSRVGTLLELSARVLKVLENTGNELQELRSELLQMFWEVEKSYRWVDENRLARWRSAVRARFWLSTLAIAGREAAMRLLGMRALSAQAPEGIEARYDLLYPIYDPALELFCPVVRPVQLRAMDWSFSDDEQQRWLNGEGADQWTFYPDAIADFKLIGERTLFIRPDWEWPREERYRGLLAHSLDHYEERDRLASHRELTYQSYIDGIGQDDDQLLIWNSERQLVGPAYRWIAINSNFARSLGWSPSELHPFEWLDKSGQVTVKSIMWRDGWIGLEPPHMESLGEGYVVLATSAAIKAILKQQPGACLHLWAERHSHGKRPCQKSWHLTSQLANFWATS